MNIKKLKRWPMNLALRKIKSFHRDNVYRPVNKHVPHSSTITNAKDVAPIFWKMKDFVVTASRPKHRPSIMRGKTWR